MANTPPPKPTPRSKIMAAIIAAAAITTMAAVPAKATSNATQWLMKEAVKEACVGGAGTFLPSGVFEQDLNNDGREDLILFHQGIRCETHAQPFTCGMQVCEAAFYIREGDLLKLKTILSTGVVEVGRGGNPLIHVSGHGGMPGLVRYRDGSFQ